MLFSTFSYRHLSQTLINTEMTTVRPGLSETNESRRNRMFSDQFRFLHTSSLTNLKASVGLILSTDSVITEDLQSSRRFISVLPKCHILGVYFNSSSFSLFPLVIVLHRLWISATMMGLVNLVPLICVVGCTNLSAIGCIVTRPSSSLPLRSRLFFILAQNKLPVRSKCLEITCLEGGK